MVASSSSKSGRRDVNERVQRALLAAFTQHLPLKLAAVFFALVLWMVVSAEEPTEQLVPVRVVVTVDTALALDGAVPSIHALVVGRWRDVLQLRAAPPLLRYHVAADVADTVRFPTSDIVLPADADVRIRDVRPRSVLLRVRRGDARVQVVDTTPVPIAPPPAPSPRQQLDAGIVPLEPVLPDTIDPVPPQPQAEPPEDPTATPASAQQNPAGRLRAQFEAARDSLRRITGQRPDSPSRTPPDTSRRLGPRRPVP